MDQLLDEIKEIRKELNSFKEKVDSDNNRKTNLLYNLTTELEIQNELLGKISSKIGSD